MSAPDWNWQNSAACNGEDVALFFGIDGERGDAKAKREQIAKAICVQCPTRAACLDYALSRPERYGLFGGLNEDERASERRRRMRRPDVHSVVALAVKTCNTCDDVKDADQFYGDPASPDGLRNACRACVCRSRKQRRDAAEAVA